MCITVSDLDALMSHTVSDSNSREAQLDQERNVAVTQIVNADSFQACRFHTSVHLMVQGNPRVYKALKNPLAEVLAELKRIENSSAVDDELLSTIQLITTTLNGLKGDRE